MNNVLKHIEIDLYDTTSYEVIKVQQGDKNSRIIEFFLFNQGEPYPLDNDVFFRFVGHRGDGSSFSKTEEECIERINNNIRVTLLEDILYYDGIIEAKLVMYKESYDTIGNAIPDSQKILSTIPFKISCIKNPCNENNLSKGEFSIVTDLIFQMKDYKEALVQKGEISFSQLPTSGNKKGHMYIINEPFITDSRFKNGSGYEILSGTKVYYTEDGKWDCISGEIIIDKELSIESENPIQNKAVTKSLPSSLEIYTGNNTISINNNVPTVINGFYTCLKNKEGTVLELKKHENLREVPIKITYNENSAMMDIEHSGGFGTKFNIGSYVDKKAEEIIDSVPNSFNIYVGNNVVPVNGSPTIINGFYTELKDKKNNTIELKEHEKLNKIPVKMIFDEETGIMNVEFANGMVSLYHIGSKSYTDVEISKAIEAHNKLSTTHSDIRTIISELGTRLNALADSDDTTLDQLSEIVAYIKSNRSLIENITTNKVNVSDVIDNISSTDADKPLSANQGKILKDLIDIVNSSLENKVDKEPGKGLSTNDFTNEEKEKLNSININTGGENSGGFSLANNAAAHNGIFRGKDLTNVYTLDEICERISSGTFEDLYIGDYFDTGLYYSGGNSKDSVKCTFAGFDTYLHTGNIEFTKHHATLLADGFGDGGYTMTPWEGDGEKGYIDTEMWLYGLPEMSTFLQNNGFNDKIIKHRTLLTNSVDKTKWCSTSNMWVDTYLNLPSEFQVTGNSAWGTSGFEIGCDKGQLPLFFLNPSATMLLESDGTRKPWWTRTIAYTSKSFSGGGAPEINFVYLNSYGQITTSSTGIFYNVRPIFCIG